MKTDHIAKASRELRDEQLDAIRTAHSAPFRLTLDGRKVRALPPAPQAKAAASTPLAKIAPARLGDALKARLKGGAK